MGLQERSYLPALRVTVGSRIGHCKSCMKPSGFRGPTDYICAQDYVGKAEDKPMREIISSACLYNQRWTVFYGSRLFELAEETALSGAVGENI